MITTGILYLIFAFIALVLSPLLLFPDVAVNATVATSITTAGNYLSALNVVLPISSLIIFFLLFLAVETGIFTYKLIKWVYIKIPGVN